MIQIIEKLMSFISDKKTPIFSIEDLNNSHGFIIKKLLTLIDRKKACFTLEDLEEINKHTPPDKIVTASDFLKLDAVRPELLVAVDNKLKGNLIYDNNSNGLHITGTLLPKDYKPNTMKLS